MNVLPILTNPRDVLPSSEEYEVEKIMGEQRRNGKIHYRIRWKGYDAEDDTWQMARDIRNASDLLKAWQQRLWCQVKLNPTTNEPQGDHVAFFLVILSPTITITAPTILMSQAQSTFTSLYIPGTWKPMTGRAPVEAGEKEVTSRTMKQRPCWVWVQMILWWIQAPMAPKR